MAKRRRVNDDPEDLFVEALEEAPPEFIACREMAHRWRVTSPFRLVDGEREEAPVRGGLRTYAERRLTCQRCGMIRSDAFAISQSYSGHTSLRKISANYTAPEGYAITGVGNTQGMRDLLYGVAFDASMGTNRDRRKKAS